MLCSWAGFKMNSKPYLFGAWSIDSPEFYAPLLLNGQKCAVLAPPPTINMSVSARIPGQTLDDSEVVVSLKNGITPAIEEILDAATYGLRQFGISRGKQVLQRIWHHVAVCDTSVERVDLLIRKRLLQGLYGAMSIKIDICSISEIENTGFQIGERLSRAEDLVFRGRGRAILDSEGELSQIQNITRAADGSALWIKAIGDRPDLRISREELDDGKARIILRGSIRPLSIEDSGIIIHAPWHSEFGTFPDNFTELSYVAGRLFSPLWQRYTTDARSLSHSWQIGAILSDYCEYSDEISTYTSAVLGAGGRVLSRADQEKLRFIAMTTHGRRSLIRSDRRIDSALFELSALLPFELKSEKSEIPLLKVVDDFLISREVHSHTREAIRILYSYLLGPLKTNLLRAFFLMDDRTIDLIRNNSTITMGRVLLPTKRRR